MAGHNALLDQRFMSLALALGRRGLGNTWPNPAVGAVGVRHDGEPVIVGRGWTQPGGRPHAETEALRRAGAAARGAKLYATLQPCSHPGGTPPWTDAGRGEDPRRHCRRPSMASRSQVRVVFDTGLRLPVTGALVRSARETPVWVMAGADAPVEAEAALVTRGVEVFRLQRVRGQESGVRNEAGAAARPFLTPYSRFLIPAALRRLPHPPTTPSLPHPRPPPPPPS